MKPKVIIGLTGCTGAGKTTALEALQSLGAFALDCDAVYHEMLQKDENLLSDLKKDFPEAFARGSFDRKALGRAVFNNRDRLQQLTEMTQRHVAEKVRRELSRCGKQVAVIDGIGLIECGLNKDCTLTVAVTAPKEIRAERIMARENISREYAMMRINAQKDGSWFARHCDKELVNDCATREEFFEKAKTMFEKVLKE